MAGEQAGRSSKSRECLASPPLEYVQDIDITFVKLYCPIKLSKISGLPPPPLLVRVAAIEPQRVAATLGGFHEWSDKLEQEVVLQQ